LIVLYLVPLFLITGSPYPDEKYKKELTNFSNYWLRSDHFSSIIVRFRFLWPWNDLEWPWI